MYMRLGHMYVWGTCTSGAHVRTFGVHVRTSGAHGVHVCTFGAHVAGAHVYGRRTHCIIMRYMRLTENI